MIEAPVYQGEKLLPADQGGEHQRCLSWSESYMLICRICMHL